MGYSRLPVPPIISSHKHVTGVIFTLRGIHMHDVKPSKKTSEGNLLCISLMHAVGSSPPVAAGSRSAVLLRDEMVYRVSEVGGQLFLPHVGFISPFSGCASD